MSLSLDSIRTAAAIAMEKQWLILNHSGVIVSRFRGENLGKIVYDI
jgi:hypothetical protein